jgi:hypothetical protein
MSKLFQILEGIITSNFADQTLQSVNEIENYAEACGDALTREEALKIQKVGKEWRYEQNNGNGEWSRMRHDAKAALSE